MVHRFKEHMASLLGVTEKHRFLLGVSGGVDSVVLAHLMHDLNANYGIAHVNYNLRGADSDADEQLVRDLAATCGVDCFVKHAPIDINSSGIQEKARDLRYNWFLEVLKNNDSETGCTIHFVTEELDAGPILIQKKCIIESSDTPYSLKQKVQKLEGQAFLEAIHLFQNHKT